MNPDLPVLIGCSHGTRSPAGRRVIAQLRLAVGALRPGLEVLAAHVDVQKPALDAVVARLSAAQRPCVGADARVAGLALRRYDEVALVGTR